MIIDITIEGQSYPISFAQSLLYRYAKALGIKITEAQAALQRIIAFDATADEFTELFTHAFIDGHVKVGKPYAFITKEWVDNMITNHGLIDILIKNLVSTMETDLPATITDTEAEKKTKPLHTTV